ncbi:HD-GYP domain-containing protein, partial [Halarcobacter ebronensis]
TASRSENELELLICERTSELMQSQKDAIFMLGEAGHFNDNDTGVHIWRMADYSALLASKIGLPEKEVELIRLAAPMHDSGKIGIPDKILKKPAKLNEEEWKIMQTHCQLGYDILKQSDTTLFKLAASIALHHHERYDGSGYPKQLKGEEIPLAARIVSICDVFDALTMKRPYKEAWSIEDAII